MSVGTVLYDDRDMEDVQPLSAAAVGTSFTNLLFKGTAGTNPTPPTGYYLVVKSLSIANPTAACEVTIQTFNGSTGTTVFQTSLAAAAEAFNQTDRDGLVIVCPAGSYLQVKASAGTPDVVAQVKLLKGGS